MSAVFRERFGASGSYKVQEIESLFQPKDTSMRPATPACVQFLDDTTYTFYIDGDRIRRHFPLSRLSKSGSPFGEPKNSVVNSDSRKRQRVFDIGSGRKQELRRKHAKGQVLLDMVTDHLDLVEPDYFGLQFVDPEFEASSDGLRWLEPHKSIKKQLKGGIPYLLTFRVKFFVSDPCLLHDEYTRYNYFLQLKRDIQEGRLPVPESVGALLASYVVQSELGDFTPDEHRTGYLADYTFILNQSPDFLLKVHELHKHHRGQTPADAEFNFLDQCKRLETYGLSLYNAKDANGVDIQLGVTFSGLVVFQNAMRLSVFSWAKIIKISFKQKQFFIQIHEEAKDYDTLLGFYMLSYRTCKNLWKSCVEHHSFFRLRSTRPLISKKFSFLSFGSRFRYSGRTEYETLEDGKRRFRVEKPSISRSPSKRYARRTVAGTSRDQILEEKPLVIQNSTKSSLIPASQSQPLHSSIIRNNSHNHVQNGGNNVTVVHVNNHNNSNGNVLNYNGSLGHSVARKGLHGVNGTLIPAVIPPVTVFNQHVAKRSSPPSAGFDGTKVDDDGGFREANFNRSSSANKSTSNHLRLDSYDTSAQNHHAPVNGISYRIMPERGLESIEATSRGPVPGSRKDVPGPLLDGIGNGVYSGLVSIKIRPDADGKFGFNVRGGVDLDLPVIVTRVAAKTPADLAVPRLNEGDQVVSINGRDTSLLTHDEVVRLIKSSYQSRSGELVLHVKPHVFNGVEQVDEPEFQYVPDTSKSNCLSGSGLLQKSMMLLSDDLKTSNALVQFEQLYKRNPKMSMRDAEVPANNMRIRYKDVLPYDDTRVLLHSVPGNDYINANYIKMEIPTSGIVNRYIAAQGPLPHTSNDFWQMVWEQQSTLIVMLTALFEVHKAKCHQYWPKLYETTDYGMLQVTCVKEQVQECFAFRELTLIHLETNEERHITHMQYIAWPDHGVPDDASDFLEFVIRVRQYRVGMNEPAIVHCSAGIGRTGVLILMETAMCLIEANEPVHPLETVKTMRNQRAMLIQTTSQYKFVCEAILRVFNDGLVKPSDDYRR